MFRVDDRIVDGPRVPAGGVLPVATVRIGPREIRLLVVSAMPESGANYPVLSIAERTAKPHIASAINKLGVDNRANAAVAAIQRGLVSQTSQLR